MSKYKVIACEFKDRATLVKALIESGIPFEESAQENCLALYGYHGDKRRETATFVIRRKDIESAANDIGFTLQQDGSYAAIISEYDSRKNGRGENILNTVKQCYATTNFLRHARMNGYMLESKKVVAGGVLRIRIKSGG